MIGHGKVTLVKSAPAFNLVPNSKLVAVAGRDPKAAALYATEHNIPTCYDSTEALLQDPSIDAVYIATPPSSHKELAIQCARAGRAVYVEKPMAITHAQCLEMVQTFEQCKRPLFVAYYRRALERFTQLKKLLVADNIIGTPRHVNCVLYRPLEARYQDPKQLPWNVVPEIAGGGLFVDLGSHTLDLLDFLFGPIAKASGFTGRQAKAYTAEDAVSMAFTFANGMQGTGLWNFASHERYDCVDVVGTHGRVKFSVFGDEPIVIHGVIGVLATIRATNPVNVQRPLIETVVAHLLGEGECPSTGGSAMRTNWVIDQVFL
jgi:predicted dehydrogenase